MYRPGFGEVVIPNEIERALEDQRLVFFCGAGISVYTGLPLFKGLVAQVFHGTYKPIQKLVGDDLPAKTAFDADQYDRALGLLEHNLTPGIMRREVIDILTKPYDGDLFLHKAILDLAHAQSGGYHLVTTNFDTRFLDAGLKQRWIHDGPRLAPPRPGDWRHATYLHGRINDDDPDGGHLVLTSADFGRAYLHDAWAARFVVELFREFTILFIGYSVKDPVMGYLVDALAAHRRSSRQFRQAFALVGFYKRRPGDLEAQGREWRAKSIEPIPFPKASAQDYGAMNQALVAWAEDHRLGLQSRINTALGATSRAYLDSDREAEQIVWALSKEDGSVARAFANADPPADPSWLRAFDEIGIPQVDGPPLKLTSFPAASSAQVNHAIPLAGPAPYAPNTLSPVCREIASWISRHLDDQRVVDWVAQRKGILHIEFANLVAWRLGQKDFRIRDLNRRFWFVVIRTTIAQSFSILNLFRVAGLKPLDYMLRRSVIILALRARPKSLA